MLAEVLGFATQTLLPTFARDVFDVGASGLGTMLALRSGGGAIGCSCWRPWGLRAGPGRSS